MAKRKRARTVADTNPKDDDLQPSLELQAVHLSL
jgi:hypothetical protein